jgi:methylmalonyl-CoA mutase
MKHENLFREFPPVSTGEWIDRLTSDLKGEDFRNRLVWRTNEGIDVMPFYRSEDITGLPYIDTMPGEFPFVRGSSVSGNNWLVRQEIEVTDHAAANARALSILNCGVSSLGFEFKNPDAVDPSFMENLLKGIYPGAAEINFLSEGKAREILSSFIKAIEKTGIAPEAVRGSFEADPLSRFMLNGKLCISFQAGLDYLADLTKLSSGLPYYRTVRAGAFNFANAGGTVVQELAFSLSMGTEYLAILTERGIDPDAAASRIKFSYGTGSNYFFEIAKLRAARLLWSMITGAFGVADEKNRKMEIHCVTGRWNKTLLDPYVNLLRTQTEAMSAVLGGADSITVESFDTVSGKKGEFSERLARNQQLLLKEEAFFGKVADPAGGSYYIERLTSMIAEEAWKLFILLEEEGGFTESLRKGIIQKSLEETCTKRIKDISDKKEILLGTNLYPDKNEKLKIPEHAELNQEDAGTRVENEIEKVVLRRGAEELEKLRMY